MHDVSGSDFRSGMENTTDTGSSAHSSVCDSAAEDIDYVTIEESDESYENDESGSSEAD